MSTYKFSFSLSSPSISTLGSTYPFFYSNSATFITRFLFEGGPICSVCNCFRPNITSRHFANGAPCRYFVKNITACVLCFSTRLVFVAFNLVLNKEITYIDVPRVPSARLLPFCFHIYFTLILFEQYVLFSIILVRTR